MPEKLFRYAMMIIALVIIVFPNILGMWAASVYMGFLYSVIGY